MIPFGIYFLSYVISYLSMRTLYRFYSKGIRPWTKGDRMVALSLSFLSVFCIMVCLIIVLVWIAGKLKNHTTKLHKYWTDNNPASW